MKSSRSADAALVSSVLLLTGFGLVTLYSASFAFAERFFGQGSYFLGKQALFAASGLAIFVAASWINLEWLRRFVKPLVLLAFLLCIFAFVPGIGLSKNGASRWIQLGPLSYQPSELVKLVAPLYLAHIFDKKKDRLEDAWSAVVPPALVIALFCLAIYLQNNFSTAAFIGANALAAFYLAGIRGRHFTAVAASALPLAVLMVLSKEYRVRRILSFIRPEEDPHGAGYQVRSSIDAIASGGFWGKGLGQGTRKISSVPEIHSDFIFSAFAEEAGFIGVLLFFALFCLFVVRGYRGALRARSDFKRLLAFSLVTTIATQALLNVAVVIGAVPATGVPLPFFSAGGSSLATTLLAAGLIVNISRPERVPEAPDV
jgi:cell division protein FtsW